MSLGIITSQNLFQMIKTSILSNLQSWRRLVMFTPTGLLLLFLNWLKGQVSLTIMLRPGNKVLHLFSFTKSNKRVRQHPTVMSSNWLDKKKKELFTAEYVAIFQILSAQVARSYLLTENNTKQILFGTKCKSNKFVLHITCNWLRLKHGTAKCPAGTLYSMYKQSYLRLILIRWRNFRIFSCSINSASTIRYLGLKLRLAAVFRLNRHNNISADATKWDNLKTGTANQ